jgi:hypothetical protein
MNKTPLNNSKLERKQSSLDHFGTIIVETHYRLIQLQKKSLMYVADVISMQCWSRAEKSGTIRKCFMLWRRPHEIRTSFSRWPPENFSFILRNHVILTMSLMACRQNTLSLPLSLPLQIFANILLWCYKQELCFRKQTCIWSILEIQGKSANNSALSWKIYRVLFIEINSSTNSVYIKTHLHNQTRLQTLNTSRVSTHISGNY